MCVCVYVDVCVHILLARDQSVMYNTSRTDLIL